MFDNYNFCNFTQESGDAEFIDMIDRAIKPTDSLEMRAAKLFLIIGSEDFEEWDDAVLVRSLGLQNAYGCTIENNRWYGYDSKDKALQGLGIADFDISKDKLSCEILDKLKEDEVVWCSKYWQKGSIFKKEEFIEALKKSFRIKENDTNTLYCKGLVLLHMCEKEPTNEDVVNRIFILSSMLGVHYEPYEPLCYVCSCQAMKWLGFGDYDLPELTEVDYKLLHYFRSIDRWSWINKYSVAMQHLPYMLK